MRSVKFLMLSLCFSLLPADSLAAEARVTDLLITNTSENLVVYLKLENCFTKKMKKRYSPGFQPPLPLSLNYIVSVVTGLIKRSILEVKHTIKYDNVKKILYVVSAGDGNKPEQFKDFSRAKAAMSELNGAVFTPLKRMTKGDRYYLRVKAKLEEVHLPLNLEYVLFFVSLWDFETDWLRQDFVY